jgi:hypothetical protein
MMTYIKIETLTDNQGVNVIATLAGSYYDSNSVKREIDMQFESRKEAIIKAQALRKAGAEFSLCVMQSKV